MKDGVEFLTVGDKRYPMLLSKIHDPPAGLYVKGRPAFDRPSVAIVGSRRPTLYGTAVATSLASELARLGFCIVSGLARGIDTAAHEGALAAGGATAAVLGTGLDVVYPPENLGLYRRIAENGAVISEFPFGRRPRRHSFPMRNRIVSGLCAAVVVVESAIDGGAMITARFGGEQGRVVFAVPGRIDQRMSAGCHALIRDGAVLLTSAADVLEELNYLEGLRPSRKNDGLPAAAGSKSRLPALDPEETRIFDCFDGGAILLPDEIANRTGLSMQQVSSALAALELRNLVGKHLDGRFEAS